MNITPAVNTKCTRSNTIEHAEQLKIGSYTELGSFNDELEAIHKTKEKYSDANGCAICCPKADTDRKHNR